MQELFIDRLEKAHSLIEGVNKENYKKPLRQEVKESAKIIKVDED